MGFECHPDRYKIKLRSLGYRLVYEVRDQELVVLVIAIGKRDRDAVYNAAEQRRRTGKRRWRCMLDTVEPTMQCD